MTKKPIKPTRAEEFRAKEEARRAPIRTPLGVIFEDRTPRPAARLLADEPCAVDVPLAEALQKRFLVGSVATLRLDLTVVASNAWAEAASAYSEHLAAPAARERREKAERLAAMLRAFVDDAEDEADAMERLADKGEDETLRPAIATRQAIAEAGGALLTHIGHLLAEPLPVGGDATNQEERAFFIELAEWWQRSATDPARRGASAVRNRIAIALWQDIGGAMPSGIAESGEEWAKRKFREHVP